MNRRQSLASVVGILLLGPASDAVWAGDVIASAEERFAVPNTKEVPQLQRHVLPLLGRLGCNGRGCHGSFQGKGGFRLSLFGYDFKADHAALTGSNDPRVDLKQPRESLILVKPSGTKADHGGGHRMDVDSWQYRLLQRWIEGGAKPVDEATAGHFVRLQVSPSEIVFQKPGDRVRLRVLCHWSDGSVEDVTPLCRFQTNDESIARIDAAGQVTAVNPGDTHVVAFYDNGVAAVPALLPVSDQVGQRYPAVAAPTKIDQLVVSKLKKLGIVPSELCTDEEFLRRVSLDLTGTLPWAEEVKAFRDDKTLDKRDRKIDELLSRPAYSAWWATRLCDYMGASTNGFRSDELHRISFADQWYRWVERRVAKNVPYDEIVADILLSVGRSAPKQTFEQYCTEMTDYVRTPDGGRFVDRKTMPWFWARQNVRTPNEMALSFSHAFLGVRIQCAECHKHPFDQWTRQDFEQFTAFFNRVNYGFVDREDQRRMLASYGIDLTRKEAGRQIALVLGREFKAGKPIPFEEVYLVPPAQARIGTERVKVIRASVGRVITPKLLGGDEMVDRHYDDPRRPLMDWLRQKDNPYFARALVNRVWANYFNVGIVDPPDDMNLANAPSNRELLDYLANGFVEHKYDIKWLHGEITRSRTYQLSWRANPTNQADRRNFSHAVPRRLPAEVIVDAVAAAAAGREELEARRKDPITLCSIGLARKAHAALAMFGKPRRDTPCDCERSSSPSMLQALTLQSSFESFGMHSEWLQAARAELTVINRKSAAIKARERQLMQTAARVEAMVKMIEEVKEKDPAQAKRLSEELRGVQAELAAARAALADTPEVRTTRAKVQELIREAYLRTFSRLPTDSELAKVTQYAVDLNDPAAALGDLFWALVNSKEFLVNH